MRFLNREEFVKVGNEALVNHPEIKDTDMFNRLGKIAKEFWIKDNGELGVKLGLNDYSDLCPLTKVVVETMPFVEKDESEFNSEIEIPFFTHDEAILKKKVMRNKTDNI